MPYVAASIIDAVATTANRVALENQTVGQAYSQFVLWNAGFLPIFNLNDANERVVRNWIVQSKMIEDEFTALGLAAGTLDPAQTQQVVETVCRMLFATREAVNFGLITAGQQAAVLAAWNASLGALP